MREAILTPIIRLAGQVVPTDFHLYRAAAIALRRRQDRTVRVVVRTCDGFRMRLKLAEYPDGSMYFGIYEPSLIRLVRGLVNRGDTAIDAGANIGYVSLHLSRALGPEGRVHSFEPMPDNLQRIRESVAENECENVTIHAQAVGSASGSVDFYGFSDQWGSWHALGSLRPLRSSNQKITCELVRLDDVVKEPVRLIKLDVEGAEVDALRGAQRIIAESRPHIIVENNPEALGAFGHSFVDVYRAVIDAYPGYRAFDVDHFTPRPLSQRAVLRGIAPAQQCNVWFQPRDKT